MENAQYNKAGFEVKTCVRCGGSGRYSFNLMDGSRCYGCSGNKVVLSKRGAAARAYFLASLDYAVADLVAGDVVYTEGAAVMSGKKWRILQNVTDLANGTRCLDFKHHSLHTGGVVSAAKTLAVRDEKLAAAIAYQSTLADNGKPKGPRVLAREAKLAAEAAAALAAEDAEVLAMADFYCAY